MSVEFTIPISAKCRTADDPDYPLQYFYRVCARAPRIGCAYMVEFYVKNTCTTPVVGRIHACIESQIGIRDTSLRYWLGGLDFESIGVIACEYGCKVTLTIDHARI